IIDEYDDALGTLGKKYDKASGKIVDMTDAEKEAFEASKDVEDSFEDIGDTADSASNAVQDFGQDGSDAFKESNSATTEQQDKLSALASDIDNITSAYQTAVDALYEYNNQGYLSVDTYSQLMQLAPEYLAMMINENGQLYNNANGVMTLYQARVYEMGVAAAR